MMIRKEKAEFLDKVLKLFDGQRILRKKDLEAKYKDESFIYHQTEKHLKILEEDGLITSNVLDEFYLQPNGAKVLGDIENLGYVAKHKIAAVGAEKEEKKGDRVLGIVQILDVLFILGLLFLGFSDGCNLSGK